MKLNWLYKFNVIKEIKGKEEEKTTNEKGEEITVKRDVVKKLPVTLAIRKANRKLYEQGELFYGVKLSEGIKAGLLTKPQLAKRYKNDGGPLSDPEKKKYAELYLELLKMQDELEKVKLNLDDRSEDERVEFASEILSRISTIREELTEYELVQTSLFDQTAETKARNATIMWWVLSLAYMKTEGSEQYMPVFGDSELYEDKIDVYDKIEDEGELFWTEVVKKFAYFVTFWYTNGITEDAQFKEVENFYKRDHGIEDETEKAPEKAPEKIEEIKAPEEAKAPEKEK